MLTWPAKDPDAVLDYDVDWTKWLFSAAELQQYNAAIAADPSLADGPVLAVVTPADTLLTSQFILPLGVTLVADSSIRTSYGAKVWLSGGTEGESYEIINRVQSLGGRKDDRTVKIKIKSK